MASRKPKKPYKAEKFEAFIKEIKKGSISHWVQIAEALGIEKGTIVVWKQTPEAQKAIKDGINHALLQMQKVGKRDWKMWKEKLGMLGISPIERADITSEGERIEGPVIYKPKKKNE